MTATHPVDPTRSPVLALRSASIGYGDRPVVHDVDLALRRGEVMALVGANGSGKTTLVRGVLGLAHVVAGSVELFGTPAERFAERWRIGYVPQRHTVVGAIPSTVTEVVGSGRLPRRPWWSRAGAADRGAVERAIDLVGLGERRTAPVATLSGGQQRRVLIARALAAEPEVLVMDEPTAGVDAEARQRLVATLETLVGQGLTMVVVTHEITPLRPILTRAVLLHHGRVRSDLPAAEAFGPAATRAPIGIGGVSALGKLADGLDAGHDPDHTAGATGGTWLGDPRLRG